MMHKVDTGFSGKWKLPCQQKGDLIIGIPLPL